MTQALNEGAPALLDLALAELVDHENQMDLFAMMNLWTLTLFGPCLFAADFPLFNPGMRNSLEGRSPLRSNGP